MAITLIDHEEGVAVNGANVTIYLGGVAAAGDYVLVTGGHPRASANAGVVTSGFTELFDDATGSNRFSASGRFLDATFTSNDTIECLGSGNTNDACVYIASIWRGVSTTSPTDATSTIATGTGEPNSPSITTVNDNSLVISSYVSGATASVLDLQPSGYTLLLNGLGGSDTNSASSSLAYLTKATAGAENPPPWDLNGTPTAAWTAATIALRQATGVVTDATFAATGTGTATFTARSTSAQPFSMTGTGTATFVDGSFTTAPAVFAATGTGTLAFTAAVTQASVAAMTGTGTASLVGASNANSLGSMTGTVTPTFGGGSLVNIVGTMTGTGTASFVNGSQSVGGGALEATGTGTAAFAAQPFDSRPFSMTGTNTSAFVGVPLATQGPFTMTGTGTALFVGTLQGQGNLAARGTADISFKGGSIDSRAFRLNGVTGNVSFVGARDRLSHIRETIESRGAVSVSIN